MFKEFFKLWNDSDLLTQAVNDSHEMLKIATGMLNILGGKFYSSDTSGLEELGEEVKKMDYLLNHYERSIRKKIYEHLTLSDKDDQEMYTSLILFSVVGDIERIGDYAKNIYEIVSTAKLTDEKLNSDIDRMYSNISDLFKRTVKAYKASEETTAREINDAFFKYKTEIDEIIESLIKENDHKNPAAYALFFRFFKRIGAHLMHISTSISNPIDKIGYYIDK